MKSVFRFLPGFKSSTILKPVHSNDKPFRCHQVLPRNSLSTSEISRAMDIKRKTDEGEIKHNKIYSSSYEEEQSTARTYNHLYEEALTCEAHGLYEIAYKAYKKLLKRTPEDKFLMEKVGAIAEMLNYKQEALDMYKKLSLQYPSHKIFNAIANLSDSLGQPQEALEAYRQANALMKAQNIFTDICMRSRTDIRER